MLILIHFLFVELLYTAECQEFSNCDPLVVENCMLPFPNNFYLRDGHIDFAPEGLPRDFLGRTINPNGAGASIDGWNALDGFSPIQSLNAYFPGLDATTLPSHRNIELSVSPNSQSLLFDVTHNEALPHFVEEDHSSDVTHEDYERVLMMWPTQALEYGHRYIVAYRNLQTVSGEPLKSSDAFIALRDNITTPNWDIEGRRALYEDTFNRISSVGFERSTLNLAWDFTVASQRTVTGRMLFMRDQSFARIPPDGPNFMITHIEDDFSPNIARLIEGHVEVPLFMDRDGPGATFVLDENGLPIQTGTTNAPFTVLIPHSVAENGNGAIVQYGHGLFGGQGEARTAYLQEQANREGYVITATDWIGLSSADVVSVTAMIAIDLSNFGIIPDRCHQGVLNSLFLMHLLTSPNFLRSQAVRFPSVLGPVINPELRYYYGNSQGAIMGAPYMGVSQQVLRGTLGVGGGPYSMLLTRSVDFDPFASVVRLRYPNTFDRVNLFTLFQMLWDRMEPSGYVNHITSDPLPDTPVKEILMQYGLGDAQVSYLGTYIMGRSMKCSTFESNVLEQDEVLFGIPFLPDESVGTGCVIVGWKFDGVPPVPQFNIPPDGDFDTHEYPRRQRASQDQMVEFFRTGGIRNTCNGSCTAPPLETRLSWLQ